MTIPADSLPGDHLRPEELRECREALCHYLANHPAPISNQQHLLDQQLSHHLSAGGVCLTQEEKMMCREDLCRFIRGEPARPLERETWAERFFSNLTALSRGFAMQTVAAFCVVLILGNTVAFAAEESMPGDTLYPIKVKVIEPARAMVSFSAEAKAEWASDCVRRRLVEAERLIARDELTPETWKSLNESIATNTEKAEKHIITLRKKKAPKAAEISADLHLALNARGQVFTDVAQVEGGVMTDVATDLSVTTAKTAALYEQSEEVAAQEDAASVELEVSRVLESASSAAFSLDSADATMPPPALERAGIARELLKSAEEFRKAGAFRESLKDARMAEQKAEEANAFVRMKLHFNIMDKQPVASSSVSSVVMPAILSSTSSTSVSAAVSSSTVSSSSSSVSTSSSQPSSKKEKSSVTSSSVASLTPSSSSISSAVESSQISLPLPVELPEDVTDLLGL